MKTLQAGVYQENFRASSFCHFEPLFSRLFSHSENIKKKSLEFENQVRIQLIDDIIKI